MHLSHLNYALWVVTTTLEVVVCVLAFRHGLQRVLPFFTAYLVLGVFSTCIRWIVYTKFGFASWPAYEAGWIPHAFTLAAQGLAIGELCFRLLRAYSGIWALAWRILLSVSVLFLLRAGIESASRPYWLGTFVLALDRDLEMTAIGVLIALLLIGRYYTLEMDSLERKIAGGLCTLSIVSVTATALMTQAVTQHLPAWLASQAWLDRAQIWWNTAQSLAAICVLAVWAVALRKPALADRPVPALLPDSAYRELSPAVNFRLRTLNARLADLLKT
jgi:hypothetical protein